MRRPAFRVVYGFCGGGVLNDVGHQPDGLLGQGRHQDAEAVLFIGGVA